MLLEEIPGRPEDIDVEETLRVLEDYKVLDVECAAMGLRPCQGIRHAIHCRGSPLRGLFAHATLL